MRKLFLPVLLILAGIAGVVKAFDFKIIESQGVKRLSECAFSVAPSTCAVGSPYAQVYGTSWSVFSTTGTSNFQVKFTTFTRSAQGTAADPNINASSSIFVSAGQSVFDKFESMAQNPMIVLTRIDTPGTTVYIDIGYLAPRAPGGF